MPDTVSEPLFGNGSQAILQSSVSRMLPVPDAALGAAGYLAEVVCILARNVLPNGLVTPTSLWSVPSSWEVSLSPRCSGVFPRVVHVMPPFGVDIICNCRDSGADQTRGVDGVTVAEALSAYEVLAKAGIAIRVVDIFSVQPVDRDALISGARACGGIVITVEDHYAHGGIGDTVLAALAEERCVVHKLAVREIPHSGKPNELLDRYGISAPHIVTASRRRISWRQ